MKRSTKFIIIFIILTVIFSAVFANISVTELSLLKKNTDNEIVQLVANIKEKYPDISDMDIAEILNGKADTQTAAETLEKYGITADSWAILPNEKASRQITIFNTAFCGVCCLVLCAVFVVYIIRRKTETAQITEYISRLNNKDYDLSIERNSEDEMSLLKNELYKVTVNLREQADNSLKAKQNLKKSLSDISHQLKTPITSILITIDNILDDENMPAAVRREFLQDIRHETNGISFLVQSLLTLSRLDTDSVAFKSKPESVNRLIDECVQRVSVLAELKGVELCKLCKDEISLCCDFRWMCEAVTNIVKNCIEHTPSGGTVKITAEKNKLYTQVTISDNGCGICEKDLPHIFERFYKGKNSSDESVGIGLALAKSIVEKSGGAISVSSTEGKGSQFSIKLFENRINKL